MAKRISTKNVGQTFDLKLHGSMGNSDYELEDVLLVKVEGEGEDRRATFSENGFEWEAYRFNGRWSYGSSADYLSVVK